jgi:membrane protein implicated in regulation of membrane protease activity
MFEFVFWHWWLIAVVLLIIEMLSPGFFFLGMAVAAAITGCLLWLIPLLDLNLQLLIFAVLSMISIFFWRRLLKNQPIASDHPFLNQRGAQYIGRTFTLIEAIENGQGKIKVDDSRWKVAGEDCPIGSIVKIVAVDGTIFKVVRVE